MAVVASGRQLRLGGFDAWLVEGEPGAPLLLWLADGLGAGAVGVPELARALAAGSSWRVCAVDCSRGAIRFPGLLTEAYRCATALAVGEAGGVAPAPALAVGGEGFGAGVAAGVTVLGRRYGEPALAAQALLAPVLDARLASPSWRRRPEAERQRLDSLFARYAPGLDRGDPLLSPLCTEDLAGLPPAAIATFEEDSARDDGERYAARLAGAGVPVLGHRYRGGADGGSARLRAARGLGSALGAIWSRVGGSAVVSSSDWADATHR